MVLSSALESINIGAVGGMAALAEMNRKYQEAAKEKELEKEQEK